MARPTYHDGIVPDLTALPMDYHGGDEDFLYDDGALIAQVGVDVRPDHSLHAVLHEVYPRNPTLAGARSGIGRRALNVIRHHFEWIVAGGVGDPYMADEDGGRLPIARQPAFLFWRAMLREGLIDEIDIMFSGRRLSRENSHLPFDTVLDEIIEPEHGADPEAVCLDYHARTEFTCGACCYLAIALHELTGWPIHAEYDRGEIRHAWVVNSDGRAVDINGVHSGRVALTKYSDPARPGNVRSISSAEAETRHDDGYEQWVLELIAAFPRHFGIEDHAARIERGGQSIGCRF